MTNVFSVIKVIISVHEERIIEISLLKNVVLLGYFKIVSHIFRPPFASRFILNLQFVH